MIYTVSICTHNKESRKKQHYTVSVINHEVNGNECIQDTFIEYIKTVENGNKTGFNTSNNRWMPHESIEGGSYIIAYGHKIQKNETYLMNGITDDEAIILLKNDIYKARIKARVEIDNKYGTGTFESLPIKHQEMLIDFVFNLGGLRKFPNLTMGIVDNNKHIICKEYKRYSSGKELIGRNKAFHSRFLQ